MALDFTLLTAEQIWGDDDGNGQLDVMKQYGTRVAPTDLAAILGGYMTPFDEGTSENDLTCDSWSASSNKAGTPRCVSLLGDKGVNGPTIRSDSVRPVLPPSETEKLPLSNRKIGVNGVEIVEFGEYPQTVANKEISTALEIAFNAEQLQKTGKNYTFDSVGLSDYDTAFRAISYPEYELDGKRYIRVLGRPSARHSRLSTKKWVQEGKPYWVEVQPIEWLMDKSGWMVSKKCLFAGIQFNTKDSYKGNFRDTFMKKYLDTYFAKEMGHEEIISRQKHDKVLTGLSARLEEAISDEAVEAIKKKLMDAEKSRKVKTTPHRLHEAARIKRLRNARDILNEAAQQAYEAGDRALLDGIINLSSTYAARYQGQQNRVAHRRAVRRAQGKQSDR